MWIVPALDELEDCELCLGVRAKCCAIDEFTFECRKEALTHCVVVAIADRTHRRTDTGLLTAPPERDRRVLCALIRMMDDIGRLPLVQCHVQSIEHKLGAQMSCHRPADDPPSAHVENDREEQKACPGRHESDVGDVQLIGPIGGEVTRNKIRRRTRTSSIICCRNSGA